MCCIVSLCTCTPTCALACHREPVYQHVLYRVTGTCVPTRAVSCHRVPVYQHVLYRVTVYLYTNTCCIVSPCTCIPTCAVSCHRVPVYQHVLYRVSVYLYTNMCSSVSPCTCTPTCALSYHCVPVNQNVLYRVTVYLYTNMCCIVSQKTEILAYLEHFFKSESFSIPVVIYSNVLVRSVLTNTHTTFPFNYIRLCQSTITRPFPDQDHQVKLLLLGGLTSHFFTYFINFMTYVKR
jgi:hypothetical protein